MIMTLKSGLKVGMRGAPEFSGTKTVCGRSFQTLADQFEKATGDEVKAIEIDPNYGLMFVLK